MLLLLLLLLHFFLARQSPSSSYDEWCRVSDAGGHSCRISSSIGGGGGGNGDIMITVDDGVVGTGDIRCV